MASDPGATPPVITKSGPALTITEILGIVIIGLLFVLIIVFLIICGRYCCRKNRGQTLKSKKTPSKSDVESAPRRQSKGKQKDTSLLQKQMWMHQLETLQQAQMAQKPDPTLYGLLSDTMNTMNYVQLKKETARLITLRQRPRSLAQQLTMDPTERQEETAEREYVQRIMDEQREELEAKAHYNGEPLIRHVPGCRGEKIVMRMDTAVEIKTTTDDTGKDERRPVRLHMNSLNDYYGKTIIICQAPMPKQFTDHWTAIWEQRVGVVVWIGGIVEGGKIKIEPYISLKEGGRVTCGSFRIHTLFSAVFKEKLAFYRVCVKNLKEESPDRELIFVHAFMWPDHRIPDEPAHLADLVAQVQGHQLKQAMQNLPALMVHCSLGVQRSPAFVSVYIGRQMWLANRRANLLGILRYIRRHRWYAFGYGDPFAQVQIVFGVMQVIAMRQEMTGIGGLSAAPEEEQVFDRTTREADAIEKSELTQKLA